MEDRLNKIEQQLQALQKFAPFQEYQRQFKSLEEQIIRISERTTEAGTGELSMKISEHFSTLISETKNSLENDYNQKIRLVDVKADKMEELRVELISLDSLVKEKAYTYELDILRDRMEDEFTRKTVFDQLEQDVSGKAYRTEVDELASKLGTSKESLETSIKELNDKVSEIQENLRGHEVNLEQFRQKNET